MALERNNRTVSVKIQGQTAEEIFALVKMIDAELPGVKITTGIKPNQYPEALRVGRFNYAYYAYLLVSFELTPAGTARPTQHNAVLAFREGNVL